MRWFRFLIVLLLLPAVALADDVDEAEAEEAGEPDAPVLTRAPELVAEVLPDYPEHLQTEGVAGDVLVRIVIDEDGVPSQVELLEGLHPELDLTAIEAAWQLLFTPAEIDGVQAAITIDYRFVFRIAEVERPKREQASATLSGTVGDRSNGQLIPEVTVSITDSDLEATTNAAGFFELTDLPAGETRVVLYHPDFQRQVQTIELVAGERLQVESFLNRADASQHETIVTGRRPWREVERAPLEADNTAVSGRWNLTRRDIELAPGAMGDVAKVVGQLPGVAADTDMFSLFYVRGGGADETAFYLDGVQLLNPNHLGGTFTMYNPKLVDRVSLYASAPPAPFAETLSGALDVSYVAGDPEQVDGIIDLNMAMGAIHLSGPLGKKGGPITFMLSARRSYFEAYFGLLRLIKLFSNDSFGMAFGEYMGSVEAKSRDGSHELRVTVLHAHDNLTIGASTDDDGLIRIDRGIDNRNRVSLVSARHRWRMSDRVSWNNLAYYTHDYANEAQDADFGRARQVTTQRPGWHSDLSVRIGPDHHLRAGVDLAYFSLSGDGNVKDPRATPTWAALPWADLGGGSVDFESDRTWTELGLYLEDEWNQIFGAPINVRTGLRVTPIHTTNEVLVSPRMGLSIPLPSMTTIKLGWGIVHQPIRDPLVLDPALGGVGLKAERAVHFTGGIQQLLPFGGLVRVETWHKVMDRLLVNPDTPAAVEAGQSFESTGTGEASGLDVMFGMRRGRVGLMASYSLQFGTRTNPLNVAGPQTYAPGWDQRHGFRVGGEVRMGPKKNWLIAGMWEIRSGRPRTPVTPQRDADGRWYVTPYSYNSRSYGTWTELSLRLEHFIVVKERAKLAFYLDILNTTYARSQFVWIYGQGTEDEAGNPVAPTPFVFRQLPIRPWFGLRGEF